MKTSEQSSFTRTELLVVVAMITVFAGLLLPAVANSKSKGDAVTCLANLRRLIQAWELYSTDNSGRLVGSYHGGFVPGVNAREKPWATGWLDWTVSSDNTNILYLTQDRYANLARYLGRDPKVFLCPADQFVSTVQKAHGWTRRCRSYSLSIGIGEGNAETGPWGNIYLHVTTTEGFRYPSPAETFVFLDEHPDSINDPGFFPPNSQTCIVDVPATLHGGAASFAFADGHLETHQWNGALASPWARRVTQGAALVNFTVPRGDSDLHWLSYHAGRYSTNSY